MVCIAAFIVLAVISVFVAVVSIFKPKVGRAWLKVFKKAWHCVFKKVRLQKCDTNFKDDVKNTLLRRVVLKKPKLVKPLSALIEIVSIVIVAVVVWALLTAVKSLLALWALGTCNVTHPSQCGLGAETCSIDSGEPDTAAGRFGRWFTEWGDIFTAVPDKFKDWSAEKWLGDGAVKLTGSTARKKAVMVADPGCSVCLNSFRNMKSSGFFKSHDVYFVVYPIRLPDGGDKFNNSTLIAKYIYASAVLSSEKTGEDAGWAKRTVRTYEVENKLAFGILDRIYTEKTNDHIVWQQKLQQMDAGEISKTLEDWLREFGADDGDLKKIRERLDSDKVKQIMEANSRLVEDEIHARGIPVEIYDGRLHHGLFRN